MQDPLDLHEIAVLCTYETALTEPRFRYAKLQRIVVDKPLEPSAPSAAAWNLLPAPKRAFFFVREPIDARGDLPDSLVTAAGLVDADATAPLTTRELETIYYEARAQDGCSRSIALLQHFFDLYPSSQPLQIRTAAAKNNSFTVSVRDRAILAFKLGNPRQCTLSELPGLSLLTGADDFMSYTVWGFASPGADEVTHVLDLAALQFGDVGRGDGGELFRLESLEQWYAGIEKVAEECNPLEPGAQRIGPAPTDEWLRAVAKQVKARWDARATTPWCGYCGKPSPPKKCACGKAYYCGPEHSTAGWAFHRWWCAAAKKKYDRT